MIKKYLHRYISGKRKRLLLLVLAGSLSIIACSKANTLIRILGTWERVNVINYNDVVVENWIFDIDDVLLITRYLRNKPDSLIYTLEGRYNVKVKWTQRYIHIYGFAGGDDFMNDDWEVVKSNKDVLIIASDKEGGLVIREFTKKKN